MHVALQLHKEIFKKALTPKKWKSIELKTLKEIILFCLRHSERKLRVYELTSRFGGCKYPVYNEREELVNQVLFRLSSFAKEIAKTKLIPMTIEEVKDCNPGEFMRMEYPKVGVCGLSCRLCPSYYIQGTSRCGSCKSEIRMTVGCPFITCAVKRKGIKFCWDCVDSETCEKWRGHREIGKKSDTFKCYQKLESNIDFIEKNGVNEFEKQQKIREKLLKEMLREFNEGRSKRYYCIVATVLEIEELKAALSEAKEGSKGLGIKEKSRILHSILDAVAAKKNYFLKLRK